MGGKESREDVVDLFHCGSKVGQMSLPLKLPPASLD